MKQPKIGEANTEISITRPVQSETQMPQASSCSTDPMPNKTDIRYVTPRTTTRGMRTPGSDEGSGTLPGKTREGEVQGNSNPTTQVAVSARLDADPTFTLNAKPSVNFRTARGKNKRATTSKKSGHYRKNMERINALNLEPSRKDL